MGFLARTPALVLLKHLVYHCRRSTPSSMKSVNRVTLLGNVTRDPELKSTTGGQTVATFGLATNRVWRGSEGEKKSLPEYHNLVAWGGLAEFTGQYIRKGKPLFVEGYLKTRSWDSGEGTKIFRTEIVVENIILLGPKSDPEGDPVAPGDVPQGSDASAPSEDASES